MGSLALSEITLPRTGKFSHLGAVESMLLALSIRKNILGADTEISDFNALFFGLLKGQAPRS